MSNIKEAFPEYEKPSVAIDSVILRTGINAYKECDKHVAKRNLQILLVRKKGEELWHLPGTILRLGETPRTAISRVVDDSNLYMEQLYTMADNPSRDERGHIISIVYIGVTTDDVEVQSDIESAWFDIIKPLGTCERLFKRVDNTEYSTFLPINKLMYDHKDIIEDTLIRIKNKLMYSNIGFEFIGNEFTLTELENTFVTINERNIPGFRRIISNKVEGTGKTISGKSFRPAELYKKKEN